MGAVGDGSCGARLESRGPVALSGLDNLCGIVA